MYPATESRRRRSDIADLLIFVHIPKTAGTTLREIVSRQYNREEVFTAGINEPWHDSVARLRMLPAADKQRLRVAQGHFGFGLHESFPQASTYMTILRDPVERAISFYTYVRQDPESRFQRFGRDWPTLREFVSDRLADELDNGQVRQLTRLNLGEGTVSDECLEHAKRNLDSHFSVVGVSERFDDSLRLCQHVFGWESVDYVSRRITANRPPKRALDQDTLRAINQANRLDVQLYAHAEKMLDTSLREVRS